MTSSSRSKPIHSLGGPRKPHPFDLPSTTIIPDPNLLLQTIDKRLNQTYSGMVRQQIKALLPNNVFPNNVLYDYIKYVYDRYQIIDPLIKYSDDRSTGSPNYGDAESFSNRNQQMISQENKGNFYRSPLQKHQSFTFRQESSSPNLLNNNSTYQRNILSVQKEVHPSPNIRQTTAPDNNIRSYPFQTKNSLPVYQQSEQPRIHSTNYLQSRPSYQSHQKLNFIPAQIHPQAFEQPTNPKDAFKKQTNYEIQDNKKQNLLRISEETNIPHRPKMLTLSSSNRRKTDNQEIGKLPEVSLKESFTDKSRLQTDHKKIEFEQIPTGYSRHERREQDKTNDYYSASERNPTMESGEIIHQAPLKRLEDRAGVSRSTSFNENNRQSNPQEGYSEQPRNLQDYMRSQNIHHRPTNSVFLNEAQGINNATNYARSQAYRSQFETPARNFKKQTQKQQATTIAKKINREHLTVDHSSHNRNPSGQQFSVAPSVNHYSQFSFPTDQIPSIYRYCFVCQHPILQFNISVHEQKCDGFKSLYSKTFEQITQIIIEKIHKFQNQINNILLDEEADRLKNIRLSVQTWMVSIKNVPESGENSIEMERNYSEIMKCFRSRQLKLLEITHKLKWFLSIRQHIKQSFDI